MLFLFVYLVFDYDINLRVEGHEKDFREVSWEAL